jgi:hypothetical protein
VDVRSARRVTSLVFYTRWEDRTHIGCDSCTSAAAKSDLMTTAVAGWWSWLGIVIAPISLFEGFFALRKPFAAEPSAALMSLADVQLRSELAAAYAAGALQQAASYGGPQLRLGGSWR